MDFSLETRQIDASVALEAWDLYKKRLYKEAAPLLQAILDLEPRNWQARLFLGACFFNLGQPFAATRAFRYVYENCAETETKQRACFAMQLVSGVVQEGRNPGAFGADAVRNPGDVLEGMLGR